ncbi:ANTAR domain-containing protein [Streptomyces sp. NPDC001500]
MTTSSRDERRRPDGTRDATAACLKQENAQLRQAVASHATVDQAVGVLMAVHRLPPDTGFEMPREVSQHTDIKLHTVAEMAIGSALGSPWRSGWEGSWRRPCSVTRTARAQRMGSGRGARALGVRRRGGRRQRRRRRRGNWGQAAACGARASSRVG